MSFTCPCCNGTFRINAEGYDTIESIEGATMDCSNCGKLLLCIDGQIKDFHKHIHEGCPEWPEDGEGTGYIEIPLED